MVHTWAMMSLPTDDWLSRRFSRSRLAFLSVVDWLIYKAIGSNMSDYSTQSWRRNDGFIHTPRVIARNWIQQIRLVLELNSPSHSGHLPVTPWLTFNNAFTKPKSIASYLSYSGIELTISMLLNSNLISLSYSRLQFSML